MTGSLRSELCQLRRAAFTIIELLVVISIISLLFGLLVPILSRTKSLARETVCQNNLRQWGIGFESYSLANDGTYPHIDGRDRQGGSTPRRDEDIADYYFGWIDVVPPHMGQKPWRDHTPWNYPDKGTIFQCTEARLASPKLYDYNPERNGFFSYAMNSCLELDSNCWHHPDDTAGPMPSFVRTTNIRQPFRKVLLFDQLLDPKKGFDGNRVYRSAGKHCGSYPKSFSARHAKKRTSLGGYILYCDYRVAFAESVWKPEWPDDLEVPPRDDLDWYP